MVCIKKIREGISGKENSKITGLEKKSDFVSKESVLKMVLEATRGEDAKSLAREATDLLHYELKSEEKLKAFWQVFYIFLGGILSTALFSLLVLHRQYNDIQIQHFMHKVLIDCERKTQETRDNANRLKI